MLFLMRWLTSWYSNANKLQVEDFQAEPKIQDCPQESTILSGPTSSEIVSGWEK